MFYNDKLYHTFDNDCKHMLKYGCAIKELFFSRMDKRNRFKSPGLSRGFFIIYAVVFAFFLSLIAWKILENAKM